MKILITGGAGFIGCHLASSYLKLGNQVTVIDNLSTGSLSNIKNLQIEKNFRFFQTDIMNKTSIEKQVIDADIVVHLAGTVGVSNIVKEPVKLIRNNVLGTENILNLCSEYNKILFLASTSEVYGKRTRMPLKETDDISFGPSSVSRWSYAASKYIDEIMALGLYRELGLKVIIGRFFNTVGPHQTGKYGMVLPRFINWALSNEPIRIYGDGTQVRTFTYVKEVCESIIKLLKNEKAIGEIINIGGETPVTIETLAHKVKHYTNSSSEIIKIPYEKIYGSNFEEINQRIPSTEKLKTLIGYAPSMDIDKIIKNTIPNKRSVETV
jgi:UDP-glucose 4-epimerase